MHITELRAENVKRLVAVSVKPDGSLVVVGGRNGQGKTSLLDSIAMALGGKDLVPAEPLRRGASKGEVCVTLDDGTVIKRTFTPAGGGTLAVTNKDGAKYGSPQKMLDGLVGKLSFDPLAFSRMDPKAQAETVRELVGLDLSAIEAKRQAAYDKRTDINREAKRIEGALAKLPPSVEGAPTAEVSIHDLSAELSTRRQHNAKRATMASGLEQLRKSAVSYKEKIAKFESDLEMVRHELDHVTATGRSLSAELAATSEANEAEVLKQIEDVQNINAAARHAIERRKLAAELAEQTAKSDALTDEISAAEDHKREKLEACKMPIDGLAFDESGVTLAGLPLAQASSAEQLRASVAIGLAMHPKLKVLLVRDGSLLDEQSLAMVAEMASLAEAQVWVERVGKGDECTVVIEDGHVVSDAKPARVQAALPMREPGAEG